MRSDQQEAPGEGAGFLCRPGSSHQDIRDQPERVKHQEGLLLPHQRPEGGRGVYQGTILFQSVRYVFLPFYNYIKVIVLKPVTQI